MYFWKKIRKKIRSQKFFFVKLAKIFQFVDLIKGGSRHKYYCMYYCNTIVCYTEEKITLKTFLKNIYQNENLQSENLFLPTKKKKNLHMVKFSEINNFVNLLTYKVLINMTNQKKTSSIRFYYNIFLYTYSKDILQDHHNIF